jgi:hypothetical protein
MELERLPRSALQSLDCGMPTRSVSFVMFYRILGANPVAVVSAAEVPPLVPDPRLLEIYAQKRSVGAQGTCGGATNIVAVSQKHASDECYEAIPVVYTLLGPSTSVAQMHSRRCTQHQVQSR